MTARAESNACRRLSTLLASAILVAAAALSSAAAQDFPTRPVRIVVPFAAGGSMDTVARLISPGMSATLKQPVLVDNRPGGGGMLAAEVVAKSPPDGHTVLLTSNSLAAAPALYRKLPFDAARDFAPVTQLVDSDSAVVVTPKLPVRTLQEFIGYAKQHPGKLNYGNTGVGGPSHLTMELLKMMSGIDVVAVPYKGMAPLDAALISGEVDVAVATVASSQGHVRAGRMRILAVTSASRSSSFPEVPTVAECGFAGFEATGWNAMFAAANTPMPILRRLQQAAARAIASPEVQSRLPALGLQSVGSTPEDFDRRFKNDLAKFARVVEKAGIPLQEF